MMLLHRLLVLLLMLGSASLVASERFCGTDTDVTFGDQHPEIGNANLLKSGRRIAWPPFKDKGRVVRYCYVSEEARDELKDLVLRALCIWSTALADQSKHSLRFLEVGAYKDKDGNLQHNYCYLDEETKDWNPKIPADTLAIHLHEDGPSATVGWEFEEDARADGRQASGRHMMRLPGKNTEDHRVAHEFGHVFGMVHEQCREDRDKFIEFRCEKLKGYNEAKELASKIDFFGMWDNKLCWDKRFAQRFGFVGSQYMLNDDNPGDPGFLDEDGFDLGSIMLYPSGAYAADPNCYGNPPDLDACPLVKLDKVDGKVVKYPINTNTAPSPGDVEFVERWYKPPKPLPPSSSQSSAQSSSQPSPQSSHQANSASSLQRRLEGSNIIRTHRIVYVDGDMVLRRG